MKILIVSKTPTHPVNAGNRNFIFNQVELFRKMGHTVFLLFIEEKGLSDRRWNEHKEIEAMLPYWEKNLFVFKITKLQKFIFNIREKLTRKLFNNGYPKVDDKYPRGLSRFVGQLNQKYNFDCCIINYWYLSKLFADISIPLRAITTHDYFSYKDLLVGKDASDTALDAHDEAKALQRCPHIFALNTEEAIFFKKLSPQSIVYNVFGVFKYNNTPVVGNHVLLFLSANHKFNINGLNWFLETIFPSIITNYPDVILRIGGSICKVLTEIINHPNIVLEGYVDSPEAFYSSADVVINPTYQGTGLKIKTFEGVSYGKVTMVHPHSLVGIFNVENAPIFSSTIAKEWVSYLNKVWGGNSFVADIKAKDKKYLSAMQNYVELEYKHFFSL